MKLKLSLLSVLLLSITLSAYASSQPTISIGNISATPMQRVQVPVILVTQNTDLVTLLMDVKYDTSIVSSPVVTIGPAGVGKTLLTSMLPSGALRISIYDLQNTLLHDGLIVNIAFTLASVAARGSTVDLTFDTKKVGAADQSGNDIAIAYINGTITVY